MWKTLILFRNVYSIRILRPKWGSDPSIHFPPKSTPRRGETSLCVFWRSFHKKKVFWPVKSEILTLTLFVEGRKESGTAWPSHKSPVYVGKPQNSTVVIVVVAVTSVVVTLIESHNVSRNVPFRRKRENDTCRHPDSTKRRSTGIPNTRVPPCQQQALVHTIRTFYER